MINASVGSDTPCGANARPLSLEEFRRQYTKRVFELLGRNEDEAALALGMKRTEFETVAGIYAR